MIGYVSVGADDLQAAERFYSSFLHDLGFALGISSEGLSYAIPGSDDAAHPPADFYVKPPFDGKAASAGNGAMVAFSFPTQAQVRRAHAAALKCGGQDEGAPGFRASYGAHFYVGYLRDPQGNKIALYCNNPDEPARPA